MSTAIEFNHISKQYRLGLVSTGTLSHDLKRLWTVSILRKEDPYLKIGSVNDRSKKADSEYVWALRDIDFKVEQGDVLGIIGKNGAGKSTLLKLLSRVTGPTLGTIRAQGRIGSLLEVGTGFHPEMTGRENIYMNGAILGMTKNEIDSKLDEIVDFSGCERYIDTPVKRYSSGMTVRLGFAVAAHLDPEILVVDEVLAVGDAEFQKRAIGKMKEVSKGEGRTVLFVSHNMNSIKALCNNAVLLKDGMVDSIGQVDDVVNLYLSNNMNRLIESSVITKANRKFETSQQLAIEKVRLLSPLMMAQDEDICVEVEVRKKDPKVKKFTMEMMVDTIAESRIGSFISKVYEVPEKDSFIVRLDLKSHNLARGKYYLSFNVGLKTDDYGFMDYDVVYNTVLFEVKYINRKSEKPIVLWREQWGNCNFIDGEIEVL